MARTPLMAGNWKMNLTVDDGVALVQALKGAVDNGAGVEVLVCPTALVVHAAAQAAAGSAVGVGGQNLFWEDSGAYTGEWSGSQLKAAGASAVIIGHSERRQYFGETDATVNKRLKAALAAGLMPIVCVGETLEERDGGKLESVITTQVRGALDGLAAADLKTLVIAYEPVWAIGTGRTASSEQAQEVHELIRKLLREQLGDLADDLRILYGGSVKPGNAAELMGMADIDGALVGGASLKADDFLGIIAGAR